MGDDGALPWPPLGELTALLQAGWGEEEGDRKGRGGRGKGGLRRGNEKGRGVLGVGTVFSA